MVGIPGTHKWNSILCLCQVSAFCLVIGAAAPPQMNFTVIDGDTTCTVMTAGIRLTIPYSGDLQNDTSFIDINTNATSSGQCDDSSVAESLSIYFNGDWSLSFIFGTWEDTLSNTSYFFINQINFTYILEPKYFQRLSYVTTCPVEGASLPESDIQLAVAVGIALGVMILATVVLYIVISKARGKDIEEYE